MIPWMLFSYSFLHYNIKYAYDSLNVIFIFQNLMDPSVWKGYPWFPWDKSLKEYRSESENATLQMAGNLKIHLWTDKGRDWWRSLLLKRLQSYFQVALVACLIHRSILNTSNVSGSSCRCSTASRRVTWYYVFCLTKHWFQRLLSSL